MADNERNEPGAPPAPPASPDPTTHPGHTAGPPPATRPPTEVTPEQVRQFQEFQRFQELMKDAAEKGLPPATPPPGFLQSWGPPPPKPGPLKRLFKATVGKIVTALVVLAALMAGGYWAINHFAGKDGPGGGCPAGECGNQRTTGNFILPEDPYEAVRMIYHDIANDDGVPEHACRRFDDGGEKFAADMGYSDCKTAIEDLATEVTDADAYAESMPSYKSTFNPKNEDEIRISSCTDSWDGINGGPPLGVFTVEKIQDSKPGPKGGKQWIITDHANEPSCATTSISPSN